MSPSRAFRDHISPLGSPSSSGQQPDPGSAGHTLRDPNPERPRVVVSTLTDMTTREKEPKPDLVDRAALAARLGVSDATVSRWFRRSILPPRDLRVGAQDVWLWATVYEWAGERSRSIASFRSQDHFQLPDVVDLAEIVDRLKVPGRTAAIWLRSGLLPAPDYRWDTTDAWLWETIERWALMMAGRIPGLARPRDLPRPTRTKEPSGPHLRLPKDRPESPI